MGKLAICSCQRWLSRDEVLSSPESDEQTKFLIKWFSSPCLCQNRNNDGDTDELNAWNQDNSRRNKQRNPVHDRINASFWILNGVRHACRDFLSTTNLDAHSNAALTLAEIAVSKQ